MSILKHKKDEAELSPDKAAAEIAPEKRPDTNISALQELIEKNIKWSQVIYEQTKKTNHRLTIMAIGSYLRLLLILVPLIFALIYLPPLFKELMNTYGSLLGGDGGNSGFMDNLNAIMKDYKGSGIEVNQVKELLKNYQK